LYVLAKHHRKCKLVNWSHPSNITACSRAPGHPTEDQGKQSNIHMQGDSSTQLPYRGPRKKTLDICPMLQVTRKSVLLRKSDFFDLHIL
jgi:hypothetical protein